MKRLKKFVSLLTAVALCTLLPGANVLTASANTPTTYIVKYVDDESGWKFQTEQWDGDEYNRDLYYMHEEIKDGDILLVDGSAELSLHIDKNLSNLTVFQASGVAVGANNIDECYVLANSLCAVNGDIKNAYVYDNAHVTFNGSIDTLQVTSTTTEFNPLITCGGTVGHVTGQNTEQVFYDIYNVAKGKLFIDIGSLKTDAAYYSTTPAAQPAPQAPAQTTTQQPAANAGEYDEVPKTGESNAILLLLGIGSLCLIGSRACKRR